MLQPDTHRRVCAVLVCVATLATPVVSAANSISEAADPAVAVPALQYQSPFSDFKWSTEKVNPPGNWKGLNDLVRDAGGISGMAGMGSMSMSGPSMADMPGMDHNSLVPKAAAKPTTLKGNRRSRPMRRVPMPDRAMSGMEMPAQPPVKKP